MRYWFDAAPPEGTGACVAYVDTGTAWVGAGDPLGPRGALAEASARFAADARRAGRRACFFASEALDDARFAKVLLGEQPIYRAAEWRAALSERRRLREQLRRARAKGVRVRRVAPGELAPGASLRLEVQRLAREWLASRHMEPMEFLLALEPFHQPDEHRYFVAERGGRAVEFLSAVPIPARNGWLVEDIVRGGEAPNGTTETLLDALFATTAPGEFVTLGLAPLTGPVPAWLRVARRLSGPLYSFAGLRAFKERLRPVAWEPVWLAYPREDALATHVVESLRAFAGGSLFAFAGRSLARHPSGPPFALAVPLVPWTLLLSGLALMGRASLLAFTSAQLAAWALSDAALAALLVWTAAHPRAARLAVAAAWAALAAVLSVLHLSRAGLGATVLDTSLRVLSTAAPVFGAIALGAARIRCAGCVERGGEVVHGRP
jgi:phosphatidylglycerol lysyltransferase